MAIAAEREFVCKDISQGSFWRAIICSISSKGPVFSMRLYNKKGAPRFYIYGYIRQDFSLFSIALFEREAKYKS